MKPMIFGAGAGVAIVAAIFGYEVWKIRKNVIETHGLAMWKSWR